MLLWRQDRRLMAVKRFKSARWIFFSPGVFHFKDFFLLLPVSERYKNVSFLSGSSWICPILRNRLCAPWSQWTLVFCFCEHYIIQCFPLPHTIRGEFSILYGSEASASSDHLKCTHFELKWWLLGLALNQLRLKSFVKVKFSQQFTYCIKVVDSKAYTKRKSSGDSRPSSAEPPEVLCNYHFVTAITSFHLLMLSGLVVKLKTI